MIKDFENVIIFDVEKNTPINKNEFVEFIAVMNNIIDTNSKNNKTTPKSKMYNRLRDFGYKNLKGSINFYTKTKNNEILDWFDETVTKDGKLRGNCKLGKNSLSYVKKNM